MAHNRDSWASNPFYNLCGAGLIICQLPSSQMINTLITNTKVSTKTRHWCLNEDQMDKQWLSDGLTFYKHQN